MLFRCLSVRHCAGKHFLVDFMAACPYDLLVKTAGGSVRYQAWCRIPKLLRLHRVIVWYKKKVNWAHCLLRAATDPCSSVDQSNVLQPTLVSLPLQHWQVLTQACAGMSGAARLAPCCDQPFCVWPGASCSLLYVVPCWYLQ